MSATHQRLPVDDRRVHEEDSEAGEYATASEAASKLREQILADPKGREAYDRTRSNVEHHQASLAHVRKLRTLAQATVAEVMGMDQSEISRLERRTDLLLSTLRRFVQATGGELHLVAHYPDGDVELLVGPVGPEPSDGGRLVEA